MASFGFLGSPRARLAYRFQSDLASISHTLAPRSPRRMLHSSPGQIKLPSASPRSKLPQPARSGRLAGIHRRGCSHSTSAYATLGLSSKASAAQIRARYLELAKSMHPDTGGSTGSGFAEVSAAYDMLSDATRRAAYDRELATRGARIPEMLAVSISQASCGSVMAATATFLSIQEVADEQMDSCSQVANALLDLSAHSAPLQPARHAQVVAVWQWLVKHQRVDAKACNSWFAYSLKRGHYKPAIQAYKHARREGFHQSQLMQSTIRQITRWANSSSSDLDVS